MIASRSLPIEHIEVTGGIVAESSDPGLIGSLRYFVSYHDPDGGSLCLWDGPERIDALHEAEACAADFRVGVIDMTGRRQ
jgi:hypothetical protein